MLGMVNSTSQWVFDRGQVCGQDGLIAVVISAHANLGIDQTDLAETIHSELIQLIPQLEKPIWHKVVTENGLHLAAKLIWQGLITKQPIRTYIWQEITLRAIIQPLLRVQ